MQSASVTPRLGLPQWGSTDRFTRADFDEAFAILDGVPGVMPVPNYASLPSTLNAADHGSCFIQTDNRALWMWYQPTTGSAGQFIRVNSLGQLAAGALTQDITTTSKSYDTAPVVTSAAANNIPGGRRLYVEFDCTSLAMDSNFPFGYIGICRPGGPMLATWQFTGNIGNAYFGRLAIDASNALPGTNQTFQLRIFGGVHPSQTSGSGIVRIGISRLYICEN